MDYLDLRQQVDDSYVEAIKDGEIIRVSETVAILEDLFVLRKITGQTQQASTHSDIKSLKPKDSLRDNSIMFDWKHGKFGGKKNNVMQDLVPNFNWEISKNRKLKNMSRLKLAQLINSTEEEVKMAELGELLKDDFVLISRLEQIFGINLRRHPQSIAQVNVADLQKKNEQIKKDASVNGLGQTSKNSSSLSGNDIEILD